ncbi:MAG: DUF5808 domain-containing protein [Bacillota bacterium]|nr:DUF5808 domain-containing protein [Bacillota bacterium]
MNNSVIEVGAVTSSLIFILILQILMPQFTRKELCFGVRIPESEAKSEEVRNINKQYILHNILIGLPSLILYVIINIYLNNPFILVAGVFVFIAVTCIPYLIAYKKVKKLKMEKQWGVGKKSVVVIDTKFSKEKNILISPWWFLIPAAIVIINIIVGIVSYGNIPNEVSTKWDIAGNATIWQHKSYGLIFQMPLAQTVMIIVIFLSYKTIGWSKQQISSSNPEESIKKNRVFRNAWAKCCIILAILNSLLLAFNNLAMLQVIKVSGKIISLVSGIYTIAMVMIIIIPIVRFGQGGSRIKSPNDKMETDIIDRNDDQFWILGQIYYNPNDPAVVVEKRFGVGWTFNIGSTRGILIVVAILVFTIGAIIASHLLSK